MAGLGYKTNCHAGPAELSDHVPGLCGTLGSLFADPCVQVLANIRWAMYAKRFRLVGAAEPHAGDAGLCRQCVCSMAMFVQNFYIILNYALLLFASLTGDRQPQSSRRVLPVPSCCHRHRLTMELRRRAAQLLPGMFYKEPTTAERVIGSSHFQPFLLHQVISIGDFNIQVGAAGNQAVCAVYGLFYWHQ